MNDCQPHDAYRCGVSATALGAAVPDRGEGFPEVGWPYRTLRFTFAEHVAPPSEIGHDAADAVREAFRTWQAAGLGLDFVETTGECEIEIGWYESHHDPECATFGCQLSHDNHAHADFPPPNTLFGGPPLPLHFHAGKRWSTDRTPLALDIESVALHEIGHCLGLRHGPVGTVMEEFLWPGEVRREIDDFTLLRAQTLYP